MQSMYFFIILILVWFTFTINDPDSVVCLKSFQPKIFHSDGPYKGLPEAFPPSNNAIRKAKSNYGSSIFGRKIFLVLQLLWSSHSFLPYFPSRFTDTRNQANCYLKQSTAANQEPAFVLFPYKVVQFKTIEDDLPTLPDLPRSSSSSLSKPKSPIR